MSHIQYIVIAPNYIVSKEHPVLLPPLQHGAGLEQALASHTPLKQHLTLSQRFPQMMFWFLCVLQAWQSACWPGSAFWTCVLVLLGKAGEQGHTLCGDTMGMEGLADCEVSDLSLVFGVSV